MLELGSWLWRWLADQPPFIEVGIGMVFILVLAPGVLAAVALGLAAYLRFGRRELHDPKLVQEKLKRDACRAQLRLAVIAPAGAVNSTVEDMARWLLLHLGHGKLDDRRIVSARRLADLHAPQMLMESGDKLSTLYDEAPYSSSHRLNVSAR